jgi:cellulose synthase operon protein C
MSRVVELLFKNGRGSEALELLNSIPVESQLASDLGRQAEQFAIDKKDFQLAEQIARKDVDANPGDFQKRFRLVQILVNSGRQPEAETALREAVDLSKSDPERRVTLVWFMVFTKQAEKAEQAIRDAEANLPQPQAPLALAQCCELVGRAYETGNTDDAMKKKKWYTEAKKWYEKAQAAQPDDLSIKRRLTKFFLDTKQMSEAKSQLESLTDKKLANSEDRFLLARLYEMSGDWPKAREKYRELNSRTKNLRDMETLNRRPIYLAQYANSLLQHHRPGEEQELTDAQELVDELKQLQPNALGTLVLQVEIDRAHNQLDRAAERILAFATTRPPPPQELETLANLAEKLGRFKLAEELYGKLAERPAAPRGKIMLALFLGRHDRAKEALDVCEPLWSNPGEIEGAASACIDVLINGTNKPDPAQLNRVSGWLDRALAQPQNQRSKTLLTVGLANLRERQKRYQEAEALYQSAVKPGERNEVAPSTLLIATSYNNLAWLMALHDGKGREALEYINHAITLKGPQPDFLDTRGVVYLTAGESQRAIDDLEKAVAVAPSSSKYFHLAQAYLGAKNKEKAKQSLEAAKIKGWEQSGLHPLEQGAYQKVLAELGAP